jgi:hypothetical protein
MEESDGCPNGHSYPENLATAADGSGSCQECARIRKRRKRARLRATRAGMPIPSWAEVRKPAGWTDPTVPEEDTL